MNGEEHGYLLVSASPTFEELLPGISSLSEMLLWIEPGRNWGDLAARFDLDAAFPDLRAITWQRAFRWVTSPFGPSGSLGPSINQHWPETIEVIATTESKHATDDRSWISRVAWAPLKWEERWQWLFESGNQNREIAYIPNSIESANRWASVAGGLDWLDRLGPASEPDPPFESEAIVRTYIRTTLRMGGVPCLKWRAEANAGLVCLGTNAQLEFAAAILGREGGRVSSDFSLVRPDNSDYIFRHRFELRRHFRIRTSTCQRIPLGRAYA